MCSVVSDSVTPRTFSPPGSSVHGILQARILEWVVISFSRGSSWPRYQTRISCGSCIGRRVLYHWHHLISPNNRLDTPKEKFRGSTNLKMNRDKWYWSLSDKCNWGLRRTGSAEKNLEIKWWKIVQVRWKLWNHSYQNLKDRKRKHRKTCCS